MSQVQQRVGQAVPRVDGRAKVTGGARYPDEIPMENVAHAVVIQSTIARGRITDIDTRDAEAAPGVRAIITTRTAPRIAAPAEPQPGQRPAPPLPVGLLQDDLIHYNGQYIGLAVADTLEQATHAAGLVRVTYAVEPLVGSFTDALPQAYTPAPGFSGPPTASRGTAEEALAAAEVRVDQLYTTPPEHHNPMGRTATTAVWDGDQLTVYDTTQGVLSTRGLLARTLGIPAENIRVVAQFVGGGFGATLLAWPHTTLAAWASRAVGRPIRMALTRQQMYTAHGFRPQTRQRVALGATRTGELTAIIHNAIADTSQYADRDERITTPTLMLYHCPNVSTARQLTRLNVITPTTMRAPGESTGMFALESALDELAYALRIDPIELRLRNYAETDPETELPWSSKGLRACYQQGAEQFGWSRRTGEPGSLRDGRYRIGLGMASAVYPYMAEPAQARVRILADGRAIVQSATTDIGPGTSTVMAQIAADALGLPIEQVSVEWGDSTFPQAPTQGGSRMTVSVGPSVQAAAIAARNNVLALARDDATSPLNAIADDQISVADGRIFVTADPSRGESYAAILARRSLGEVEGRFEPGEQAQPAQFSTHIWGAQFAEVRVDLDTGEVRVTRFVGAYDAGRILNLQTARSQMIGGITGGIGMALMEQSLLDHNVGRYTTANLWGYYVPVNADVGTIEVLFIDQPDLNANVLGAKGLAEVCLVGAAGAIANAVYHATGRRIRDLPITPEKLL